MKAPSLACSRTTRPFFAGRRSLVVNLSANVAGPSTLPNRPGGGAARYSIGSMDEVPSDAEGDVPIVAIRPSGGAFRGVPTSPPGTAGAVGQISFSRPGGGCMRYNEAPGSTQPSGSSGGPLWSGGDMLSRPSGGGARLVPSGLGPGGGSGPTDGGSGGAGGSGGGGDGSSSGGKRGGAPGGGDEPLGLSSLAPWALLYAGVCGGLYWAHEAFIEKKDAAEPVQAKPELQAAAAAPAAAAGGKCCCKKKGGKGK
ncbi:hypothetical protein Agub_g6398 [Astrephomene gubernaculifera]|uniref:Uncharacterized protein n=1 Tax=Astrephomene gubernaculifera TaxID=47775 RepID=A0AAD3DSC9_9CHLO|nr:hypothetical protein Agub_g6398 [Astrephomene gubernaculifera]